jgi:hypothetical protein
LSLWKISVLSTNPPNRSAPSPAATAAESVIGLLAEDVRTSPTTGIDSTAIGPSRHARAKCEQMHRETSGARFVGPGGLEAGARVGVVKIRSNRVARVARRDERRGRGRLSSPRT